MSASPARHRVMRVDVIDASREFWAAKTLVDEAEPTTAPKHARKVSPRYAVNVGRVGALAVSLGIGLAIANAATGTAYAETDTDGSSTNAPAADAGDNDAGDNDDAGDNNKVDANDDDPDSNDDEDIDDEDIDDEDIDDEDIDDEDNDSNDADDPDVDEDTGPQIESVKIDTGTPEAAANGDDGNAEPAGGTPVPVDTVVPLVTAGATTLPTEPVPTAEPANTVSTETAEVDVVGAVVSTLIAPLAKSEAAAVSPLADPVQTWIQRILSHIFSNKTPVVNSVDVTTVLGVATITIDAYDPNGDPLTYEIVSGSGPSNGLVVQILPGVFVYTPDPFKLLQGPVQDTFTVKIRDDSEHLTGTLGSIQTLLESLFRAFGFAQRDNYDQVVQLTVNPIIDLPGVAPIVITTGGTTYRLGSPGVKPLTSVSITDIDSGYVKGATVSVTKTDLLSPDYVSGDTLVFADTDKITGSYNASTGVLTLTGTATKAEYEAALESVTFTATQVVEGLLGLTTVGRTLTVIVTDSSGVSNSLLPAFALMSVDYALPGSKPVVTASGATPTFVFGKGAVAALTSVTISDNDSTNLSGATVTVTASPLLIPVFVSGDKLTFANTAKITGSYNAGTGVLTLTGTATLAEYAAALQSITFSATEGGGILGALADRTVTVTVADDGATPATSDADSATVKVANPAPPSVSLSGATPKFIFGKGAVAALTSVTVSDSDSTMLSGAKVTVTASPLLIPVFVSGDKLTFANTADIVGSYNSSTGVLTLTGNATLAAYQAALQSITFSATQGGGLLGAMTDRTVTVTVTDETNATSDADSATVKVADPAPPSVSLWGTDLLGSTTVKVGGAAERAIENATIDDSDSAMLSKAVVAVKLQLDGDYVSGDTLSYVAANGISIQSNTGGVLTLTGLASKAAYEAALESITVRVTSGGGFLGVPLPRTLSVTLTDDEGLTGSQTMTIFVSVI